MGPRSHGWATVLHRLNLCLIAGVLLYAASRAAFGEGLELGAGSSSEQVLDLLAFSLLCGLAAFATIEVSKRLFDLRGRFQLRRTRDWFESRSKEKTDAFAQLERAMGLINGGDARRVFNLPTEQLAAQIGAAADVALTTPRGYQGLVAALAGRSESDEPVEPQDEERFRDLAQHVRAGVDQLQIALSEDWRRLVQAGALWVAGLYGIAFAYAGDIGTSAHPRYVLMALILGGVSAWVARDITRVIENARR